jgi:phosphatidylinositol alpha-mannosyltransferase
VTRLHIALVHPFSWPEVRRGGERYLADLAWYLERAGHRVELITGTSGASTSSRGGDVTIRKLRHLRGRATRLVARDADESFGFRAFPRLVARRFDVVHAFVPSAAIAARAAGQRTIYTVLGHPSAELVAALPRARRLMRAAVRSASAVVALSQASARATEEVFGRATGILPPGVILDRFPLAAAPRTGPPRLLFNAFASNPEKGLGTLVDAFAMLLGRVPDARLVLAGPGEPDWALSRLDARARASVEVLGPGRLEDVPLRYREATVTVLPSTNEAFGLVLVESLASGTPVVCSAVGGPPEIVDRPEIGRVAPYADPPALATAIEEVIGLARDPATPERCRTHARRFDWEAAVGPLHERLYVAIRDRARKRSG